MGPAKERLGRVAFGYPRLRLAKVGDFPPDRGGIRRHGKGYIAPKSANTGAILRAGLEIQGRIARPPHREAMGGPRKSDGAAEREAGATSECFPGGVLARGPPWRAIGDGRVRRPLCDSGSRTISRTRRSIDNSVLRPRPTRRHRGLAQQEDGE